MDTDSIRNIVVLTGAGISAESGVATFRGAGGLWEGHRVEDVATPEAFDRNPDLVQQFYDLRREQVRQVLPNPAHEALARLDAEWEGELLIITQNIDDLHDRAAIPPRCGSDSRILHMHGELLSAWCLACDERSFWEESLLEKPRCPRCGVAGQMRPNVVWFGEIPYGMDTIERNMASADLFVSIGTSGAVYPAAGLVELAKHQGAYTVELNLEPSQGSHYFDESQLGPAGQRVPEFVERLLGS